MHENSFETSKFSGAIEITLDGLPVAPPSESHSLNAIRCHLEALALANQRVLCHLSVDGVPANLTRPLPAPDTFCRVEAESVALHKSSVLLLNTAFQQAAHVRESVEAAIALVLINDLHVARELWWNLATQLKEPVLTLSALPANACAPAGGQASLTQLRKWQLEQIAAVIQDVEAACDSGDTIQLSEALESRVLPWVIKLSELIHLWHETALAGARLGTNDVVA